MVHPRLYKMRSDKQCLCDNLEMFLFVLPLICFRTMTHFAIPKVRFSLNLIFKYRNFNIQKKKYIGTGEKNPVMECHLYTCMGTLALTHNFTWSRWNLLAGRRSCILLMREIIENRKLVRLSLRMYNRMNCEYIPSIHIYSRTILHYM